MNMSFYTAAVGAEQQQTRLDVLGNNIANLNNTGFCAKRPVFTALMYDFMDGVDGARLPRGSGAYMSSADSNFAAQAMPDTGRAQDYAIEGDGFFALWDPATEEYSYTRDGSFVVSMFTVPLEEGEEPELDADGNEILEKTVWYLSDGDGRFVLSNEGRLIEVEDQNAQQPVGVFDFVNTNGMQNVGEKRYVPVEKNGEVMLGTGRVVWQHLQASNVALEPANSLGEIDGIETIEPAYGIPSRWILPENKEMAEIYGYTVIDPLSVMLTHLSETIKQHAYELLTRTETIQLVENMKKTAPELADEACPAIVSYALLEKILRNLLMEGIPIRDMVTILETIVDAMNSTRDPDLITESVRGALSRTITRRFCENGQLRVITLDSEVERRVVSSLTKNEHGIYLSMGPELLQPIISQIADCLPKFADLGSSPVLLTSQVIRIYMSRLLRQYFPNLCVLAFNEIVGTAQIQALGNITVQQTPGKKAVGL